MFSFIWYRLKIKNHRSELAKHLVELGQYSVWTKRQFDTAISDSFKQEIKYLIKWAVLLLLENSIYYIIFISLR